MFRVTLTFFAVANIACAFYFGNDFNWFVGGMCTACAIDTFIREKSYE